jgi:hypothetical protein
VKANGSQGEFVFSVRRGRTRAKARLDYLIAKDTGAPLPHWTLHDLRRTATEGMAKSELASQGDQLCNIGSRKN